MVQLFNLLGHSPWVSAQATTTVPTQVLDSVSCYACGLADVDPVSEEGLGSKPGLFFGYFWQMELIFHKTTMKNIFYQYPTM